MAKPSAVVVRFLGNTRQLDKSVRGAEKRMTAMKKVGRVANLALAAGVTAVAGVIVSGARKFDEAQSIIQNATGKSGDELKGLTDEFQNVLGSVNKAPEAVAAVIGTLDTLVDGTDEQIGKLAYRLEGLGDVIGGEFTANAEKWGRIVNLWGLSADEASRSLDTLTHVGQAYGISGDELMGRLQKHGETFKTLGLDVDEAALAMGELFAKGADMRTLASGLDMLAGKAVRMGQDPEQAFKDLTAAIQGAESRQEGLSLAMEYMGDKAAIALVDAVQDGIDITKDYDDAIRENKGLLDGQIEANKSVAEKIDEVKNKVLVLGMKLAECLIPHFEKIIDWMSEDGNLNKALIAIGVALGALFTAKMIAGLATLIAKIKLIGTTATAAAGAATVAGGAATGAGLALVLAKLGLIAAAIAVPFTIFFVIKWFDEPMTPEQEAVRDRVFGRGKWAAGGGPDQTFGPTTTSARDPGLGWRPPAGPGAMVPGAGAGTAVLGALGRTGRGFGYPQGGVPTEPPAAPTFRGPRHHPGGRSVVGPGRTGPVAYWG